STRWPSWTSSRLRCRTYTPWPPQNGLPRYVSSATRNGWSVNGVLRSAADRGTADILEVKHLRVSSRVLCGLWDQRTVEPPNSDYGRPVVPPSSTSDCPVM